MSNRSTRHASPRTHSLRSSHSEFLKRWPERVREMMPAVNKSVTVTANPHSHHSRASTRCIGLVRHGLCCSLFNVNPTESKHSRFQCANNDGKGKVTKGGHRNAPHSRFVIAFYWNLVELKRNL